METAKNLKTKGRELVSILQAPRNTFEIFMVSKFRPLIFDTGYTKGTPAKCAPLYTNKCTSNQQNKLYRMSTKND